MAEPPAPTGERELLLQLVDTVVDYAIFVLDTEGHVASWNAGAEQLKGYRRDEIIGSHFSCFYPPEARAAGFPERELAIATSDGRFEDEGWRVRRDGSAFWADVVITAIRGADGRLAGFGKVTRDLTERRRGEDALRASEQRFRLLVSSVADYAIFLLTPEGRVASWNLGAERLKGYAADEIIGEPHTRFYPEEDRRRGVPELGLRTAADEGRWEHEGWRIRRDGTRFWADVVITALRTPDGELHGYAKVTRDLTDRKRNEDALRGVLERERHAAARLAEVDRLRTELVAMVAHDLRAPVGVLQHLVRTLRDEWTTLGDDERSSILDRTAARTDNLAVFVDDAFDVARIEAGVLTTARAPFDLGPVVADVVDDERLTGGSRRIDLAIHGRCPVVADEQRCRQVVTNLVSNALKYSPADAPVSVDVRRTDGDVIITVADRGAGITEEQQVQLFQPFTRLPQSTGIPGSGLGLFIARSLVHAQGGRIWVESSPAGSTFCVALPAADPTS